MKTLKLFVFALLLGASAMNGQSVNGEIFGVVRDATSASVVGAKVQIANRDTGITKEITTDEEGRYRVPLLPPGFYTVITEKSGFRKDQAGPFELRLNQSAEINVKLEVGGLTETVSVSAEATVINTTNAEVSTTFETKRITEVPLAPNRNILNLALNIPGVNQLSSGQSGFASGINMAVNGMRTRSNNFMIDGQDVNDPSVTGSTQGINNTDVVAEFRVITNQFAAEYGRAAGSVVNIVTKSGTNDLHGSLFWFNNNNALNTRSNLDKQRPVDAERTPFRNENQLGGTVGGRIIKNRTFYFGAYQRWWDRRLGTGTVVDGPPTDAGRALLSPFAASRPALKAMLDYLPSGSPFAGARTENVVIGGQTLTIPYGRLGGAASRSFDDDQASVRIDHRLTDKHQIGGRYMYQDNADSGAGQVTPPGLTTLTPNRNQLGGFFWNSSFTPHMYSEFRLSYTRQAQETTATDVRSQAIPSIEINSIGLTGFNAAASRTAIGLAVNLPQFRKSNTYQIQHNIGWLKNSHSFKFGYDLKRNNTASFFVPTTRGRLVYNNLQDLVDDVAQSTQINGPIRGGQIMQYYQYYDYFFYGQDEWRIKPNFTLTYGLRYELPGNPFNSLQPINDRIVAANNNDARYRVNFPSRDSNNIQPRVGFNYRFGRAPGMLGAITGDGLVLRGGYARTNDFAFLNIALNIFSAFPFVASYNLDARTPNSYPLLVSALQRPITDPNSLTRTNVTSDFRSPAADQVSLQAQRQLGTNWSLSAGYVGTRGTGLFQTIDGNPIRNIRVASIAANGNYTFASPALTDRVNPGLGVVRTRANSASSTYHSMQLSLEKRYSRGFTMGAHYTWSSYIDTASEVFNPAVNGDVAVSQDSYNRNVDRARSTYDRPHRFSMTHTWEIPYRGRGSYVLGGWQINGFLTFQSGAPFTPLNGTDPFFRLSGIDGLVGNAIRPDVAPGVSISGRNVEELYAVRTTLYTPVAATPARVGSLTVGQVIPVDGRMLGNAGRNTLRADGIGNYDFGILKRFKITEGNQLQLRADFFNLTNTRNFGIPESRVNSANFLNQWGQDGGNRRIQVGVRYVF